MSTPGKNSAGGGALQGHSLKFEHQAPPVGNLPDLSKIPIERLQEVEKKLQGKMWAMLEAGVPVLIAAATANHIVQDLLTEALSHRSSRGAASMH